MPTVTQKVKMQIRRWEEQNLVYGKGYVDKTTGNGKSVGDNMQRRGYDVMRISPRPTTKFGLKYRAVYGSQVVPNYSAHQSGAKQKKFYPKVQWFQQGYIKAGKKSGTFVLNRGIFRDFQNTPLRSQLMMKRMK